MGRILAIDYGQKRVGLAVTDELKIIATGLDTIHVKDIKSFLTDYVKRENVEMFVVGEPKKLDFTDSDSVRFINPFVKWLTTAFPLIPIERVDERFTSKMAFQTMIDSGIGKKARQDKALVDKISATIILQSFMSTRKF